MDFIRMYTDVGHTKSTTVYNEYAESRERTQSISNQK